MLCPRAVIAYGRRKKSRNETDTDARLYKEEAVKTSGNKKIKGIIYESSLMFYFQRNGSTVVCTSVGWQLYIIASVSWPWTGLVLVV